VDDATAGFQNFKSGGQQGMPKFRIVAVQATQCIGLKLLQGFDCDYRRRSIRFAKAIVVRKYVDSVHEFAHW
jgi:hypothetical protein